MDVVEAKREDWKFDPFVFREEGGYFLGRGTSDMKNGDVATTMAPVSRRAAATGRTVPCMNDLDDSGTADARLASAGGQALRRRAAVGRALHEQALRELVAFLEPP